MTQTTYQHVIEYDENTATITISRLFRSGEAHLYTKLVLMELEPTSRSLHGVGCMLGEAIIFDTPGLRDLLVP